MVGFGTVCVLLEWSFGVGPGVAELALAGAGVHEGVVQIVDLVPRQVAERVFPAVDLPVPEVHSHLDLHKLTWRAFSKVTWRRISDLRIKFIC